MILMIVIVALLLWIVIGGIVAILVCPLLQEGGDHAMSPGRPSEETVTGPTSASPTHVGFSEHGHKPL